jgi:hypothetical protein
MRVIIVAIFNHFGTIRNFWSRYSMAIILMVAKSIEAIWIIEQIEVIIRIIGGKVIQFSSRALYSSAKIRIGMGFIAGSAFSYFLFTTRNILD